MSIHKKSCVAKWESNPELAMIRNGGEYVEGHCVYPDEKDPFVSFLRPFPFISVSLN
jgi:hypothetical protein